MSILNLKITYITLTLFTIFLLLVIGFKTINKTYLDKKTANKKRRKLILGLLFLQIYIYGIAYSGVLDNFDFPPRFFIFLILPMFSFTGIYIYKNRNSDWLSKIPEHWLIFFQSFRILVESLFVATVAKGILNKEVTIEGYNFDMIFAYTAPIIGYLAYKKIASRKVLLIWNYTGLLVIASIIFLFLSSIFNPQLFGSETMLLPAESVKYPYVLVAGFLMPTAVFIHVLSIAQLSKNSKNKLK